MGIKGEFKRTAGVHRNVVCADGDYPPAAGRYHLYVALACPWADGCLTSLYFKGLEDAIGVSIVHPTWCATRPGVDEHCGWHFKSPGDAAVANPAGHGANECDDALVPDTVNGCATVRELYELAKDTGGKYSTPVLWDKETSTIVSNESLDILRSFDSAFDEFAKCPDARLFPSDEALAKELDELNETLVYPKVNNGVYRCGFARTQEAYDAAVGELFGALDALEERLATRRYLGGDNFTWLDMRLFHTLVRFDPVYITYFKTNVRRLVDYPALLGYTRELYQMPALRRAINMRHIKMHYFTSHPVLNTFGIVPAYDGPDLDAPHGREGVGGGGQ